MTSDFYDEQVISLLWMRYLPSHRFFALNRVVEVLFSTTRLALTWPILIRAINVFQPLQHFLEDPSVSQRVMIFDECTYMIHWHRLPRGLEIDCSLLSKYGSLRAMCPLSSALCDRLSWNHTHGAPLPGRQLYIARRPLQLHNFSSTACLFKFLVAQPGESLLDHTNWFSK